MKTEDDFLVFDDEEAIQFIMDNVSGDVQTTITKDKVSYVLDAVYEFYDQAGLIDEDTAESAEIDEDKMQTYIEQCVDEDDVDISADEIEAILEGEFAYGQSKGIYE